MPFSKRCTFSETSCRVRKRTTKCIRMIFFVNLFTMPGLKLKIMIVDFVFLPALLNSWPEVREIAPVSKLRWPHKKKTSKKGLNVQRDATARQVVGGGEKSIFCCLGTKKWDTKKLKIPPSLSGRRFSEAKPPYHVTPFANKFSCRTLACTWKEEERATFISNQETFYAIFCWQEKLAIALIESRR